MQSSYPPDDNNKQSDEPGDLHELYGSENKTLWIVTDDKENQQWVFTCRTLYPVQISKKYNREVERSLVVPYSDLWTYFGTDVEVCDKSDIKMFMSMLLDCMELEMPTIGMKRHKDEDSDVEEEVHIKLNPLDIICHARSIVDVGNCKMPLTFSLVGNQKKYFGIKCVLFNRDIMKEEGVFLRVETDEWLHDQQTIQTLPKHKANDKLKHFYSLPKLLEEKGFADIFHKLQFSQEKSPMIENAFGDLTDIDAYSKRFSL